MEHVSSGDRRAVTGVDCCGLVHDADRSSSARAAGRSQLSQHLRGGHAADSAAPGDHDRSDGLPNDPLPNPRLWGTFPRVLGRYSRDEKLFTVSEAVHKMTGMPAQRFAIAERGRIESASIGLRAVCQSWTSGGSSGTLHTGD